MAAARLGSCRQVQYLLDTDWAIQRLNGYERFARRIDELMPAGIGISAISLAEIHEGVLGAPDPERRERELSALLEQLDILDVDADIARVFARLRNRLRSEGQLFGDMDLLIGATALRHELTLLTNNRRHFERISDLAIESI